MKFSYNWLQNYFDQALPLPAEVAEMFTFHSSEVEDIITVGDDTVFDIKVLPDKSAWLMSHRGLAREFSQIAKFRFLMRNDHLAGEVSFGDQLLDVQITLETPVCDFYGAALISGVKVGPSPVWLKTWLEAIGQRSINNIVDATNYVMFDLGQPLHAFDAQTFIPDSEGVRTVCVRAAKEGEKLATLSNEELTLTTNDTVITDGVTGNPLALAGVKGGLNSGVTEATTTILLESAHFERVATRLSARRHKQTTDAAKRYENGLSRSVAPYGLMAGAQLIADIAGGTVVGFATAGTSDVVRPEVTVTVQDINRVLGITIDAQTVAGILKRFEYKVEQDGEVFTVTPTHERDDIQIKQDLIEEVGRVYGLTHIVSIAPLKALVETLNIRHYYAEQIRDVLTGLGFSEIYTSSFRNQDVVKIQNALASDKSYLRSKLHENLKEAVQKNSAHRDLLGVSAIKVFEIGTVFTPEGEYFRVALGVQTGSTYKAKVDDALLKVAQEALVESLGVSIEWEGTQDGVTEFTLDSLLPKLPAVTSYKTIVKTVDAKYEPFSLYPSVTRDVALWVPVTTTAEAVEAKLVQAAGELCVRVTLFDTFIKDDRTSLGFRLVFQSKQKTLTASDADAQMSAVYDACSKSGWEVR